MGIAQGIILPGFLRWCRISSIRSIQGTEPFWAGVGCSVKSQRPLGAWLRLKLMYRNGTLVNRTKDSNLRFALFWNFEPHPDQENQDLHEESRKLALSAGCLGARVPSEAALERGRLRRNRSSQNTRSPLVHGAHCPNLPPCWETQLR